MNARIQNRYVTDAVDTASPARLLVRLYDRLVIDLQRGERAIVDADLGAAHEQLLHAQSIVTELRATLRVDAWEGGEALAQVYDFCHRELVAANVGKDAARVAAVRSLLEPIRDAWHTAAGSADAAPAPMSA